jgi:antitoxin PrlF
VRTELKVNTGGRVEFVRIAPGRYEFMAATCDITELKGMFGPAQQRVTREDMDVAVAQAAAAR